MSHLRDEILQDLVRAPTLGEVWHTAQRVHLYGHDCASGKWVHPDYPIDTSSQWDASVEEIISYLGYDSTELISELFSLVLGKYFHDDIEK